ERAEPVRLDTQPRRVLEGLRRSSWEGVFVVDDGGRYLGVATRSAVARGERVGSLDLRQTVSEEAPTVHVDAPLSSVLAMSAAAALRIAVLDDDGRLLGTRSHTALLSALAGGDGAISGPASPDPEGSVEDELATVGTGTT